MTFVDRAFLAKRSTEDVAAALPGGLLSFTFMSFFVVTTGFASTLVAQRHGKEDREGCVQATWAAFHLSLIAGLFCVGVSFLGPWIIQISHHPESVMWREKIYFQMLVPGGGFECMNMAFCAFFAGQSRTWVVSLVSLIKCSVNAVLAYALIFGKWGAPEMGIAGAGLATFLATALGPFISGAFFLLQDQSRFRTRHLAAPNASEILRLLRFGSRSGVQVLLDVAAWSLVLFVVGDLGQSALAATTIAMSINMISFMPLLGVSDATSILVGQYIGRGSKEISTRAAFTAWKMAASYMVLMAVVFLALPQHLFRFFRPTGGGGQEFQEVMGYARSILACAACYNFFDATIFVFMGALRGAGDTKGPMWIMLCLAWGLLVPGTLWMIKGLHCTVLGLWVFITCYASLVCLMMFRRFQSGQW
jgi:MATE family multidrug resistance protein